MLVAVLVVDRAGWWCCCGEATSVVCALCSFCSLCGLCVDSRLAIPTLAAPALALTGDTGPLGDVGRIGPLSESSYKVWCIVSLEVRCSVGRGSTDWVVNTDTGSRYTLLTPLLVAAALAVGERGE